jgi:hypothetical protein
MGKQSEVTKILKLEGELLGNKDTTSIRLIFWG